MSVVKSYLSHNSRSSKRDFFFNLENLTNICITSFSTQKYINLDVRYLCGMCYNQKQLFETTDGQVLHLLTLLTVHCKL